MACSDTLYDLVICRRLNLRGHGVATLTKHLYVSLAPQSLIAPQFCPEQFGVCLQLNW